MTHFSHLFYVYYVHFIHSLVIQSNPPFRPAHLAAELDVVKRRCWRWVASPHDAEARARRSWLVVLKCKPPCINIAERDTANLVVVGFSVRNGWNGLVGSWARHRPASFGDPHRLALGATHGGIICIPECGIAVRDAVGEGGLIVRVGVHANEVTGSNHGRIAPVDPRSPGIDVPDLGRRRSSTGDGRAHLRDIRGESSGTSSDAGIVGDTSGCDSVKILRSDRNTSNQRCESSAVLGDGSLEGVDLVGDGSLTSRGPQTEQKSGLGVDGGLNSRCRAVGRATLDHGVQTCACERVDWANEVLSTRELALEVGRLFGGAVGEGWAIVESFDGRGSCRSGHQGGRHGQNGRGAHRDVRCQ